MEVILVACSRHGALTLGCLASKWRRVRRDLPTFSSRAAFSIGKEILMAGHTCEKKADPNISPYLRQSLRTLKEVQQDREDLRLLPPTGPHASGPQGTKKQP